MVTPVTGFLASLKSLRRGRVRLPELFECTQEWHTYLRSLSPHDWRVLPPTLPHTYVQVGSIGRDLL